MAAEKRKAKIKPRPRGRPSIPKDQRKSNVLHIRLSEADREFLEEKAKLSGQGLAEWIRERILGN